jgi:hypothetical protein
MDRRTALRDASTSGCAASQSDIAVEPTNLRRGCLPPAIGQKRNNSSCRFLNGASSHIDQGPIIARAESARERYLLGHCLPVDILIVIMLHI